MNPDPAAQTILDEILAGITAKGTHVYRWSTLRSTAFPGLNSWNRLKDWCLDNVVECELSFGQSSKDAEVQFRKLRVSN